MLERVTKKASVWVSDNDETLTNDFYDTIVSISGQKEDTYLCNMDCPNCDWCGQLRLYKDKETIVCSVCGEKVWLSAEYIDALYERNSMLMIAETYFTTCQFKDAVKAYDEVIKAHPEMPEAYWGRMKSRFGVEFQRYCDGGPVVPTFHFPMDVSIYDDADYRYLHENFGDFFDAIYKTYAEKIEEARKNPIDATTFAEQNFIPVPDETEEKPADKPSGLAVSQEEIVVQIESKTSLPTQSVAHDKETYEGLDTYAEGNKKVVLSYSGTATELDLRGTNITDIGQAFRQNTRLTSIILPDSLMSIGEFAFEGCSSLTTVIISDSVTSIAEGAFSGCSALVSMTLPFVGGSHKTNMVYFPYPFGYIFGTKSYNGSTAIEQIYFIRKNIKRVSSTYYVPKSLRSVTITGGSIQYSAFMNCSRLTAINLLEGVERIGRGAFEGCSSLSTLNLPDSLERIEEEAFDGCQKLTSITIPRGVTEIQPVTSMNGSCGLKIVNISEGVTTLKRYAFKGCSGLTTITIPHTMTDIEDSAFECCSSLTTITFGDGVTNIGESAFRGCSSLTTITFGEGVTSIGESAFRGCSSLTDITIPDSVTSIAEGAFSGCSALVSMTLPFVGGAREADASLFQNHFGYIFGGLSYNGCSEINLSDLARVSYLSRSPSYFVPTALRSVTIRGGDIGRGAFFGCDMLTGITIPDSLERIGDSAFWRCRKLTAITLPNGLESIADSAFKSCSSLITIDIPDSVTSIGVAAFNGCSHLIDISLPKGLTSIERYTFDECASLTTITLPKGVMSIGNQAFCCCSNLSTVNMPDSLRKIGPEAFADCRAMSDITIPQGVIYIGSDAFAGCEKLVHFTNLSECNVYLYSNLGLEVRTSTAAPFVNQLSTDDDGYVTFTVGDRKYLFGYIGRDTELDLTGRGYTDIYRYALYRNENALYKNEGLTSITIPHGVNSIGNGAFFGCARLASLALPEGVTSIGYDAFARCSSLRSITIPDSVKSIKESAFYYCSSLTTVTIPHGVTSIERALFVGCSSLTTVHIPDSVVLVDVDAFSDCRSLTTICFPNSVKHIKLRSFSWCSSLTSIVFSDSLTTIGERAFSDNSSLPTVTIPKSVTSIGYDAFEGCSKLATVTIDSAQIATSLTEQEASGSIVRYATTIYVKSTITDVGSYVTTDYSVVTSDKEGYVKHVLLPTKRASDHRSRD